jgi:hypothetical protein
MGIFEFIYYAFVAKTVISAMTPQQTNNTAQYDAEAAEARRFSLFSEFLSLIVIPSTHVIITNKTTM